MSRSPSTHFRAASFGRHRAPRNRRPYSYSIFFPGLTLLLLIGTSVVATGVGSAAVAAPVSSPRDKAQLSLTCTRVADVLSDGPDPTVDPVGYALAQVLPLREIKTSDRELGRDIETLASAYETVYKTNGKKGTEAAVDKAGRKLDSICPGAF
jgi:hypothetical protein